MKLGMTGNRNGISDEAKKVFLDFINNNEIKEAHHGDCLGADKDFHDIFNNKNLRIIIHPPNDNKMRAFCKSDNILQPKKFLDRNHDIVNNTDMLIAFPSTKNEILRSGTWATIRYARKQKKNILIVYPDGNYSED
jgi:hypothetical protein